MNRPALVYVVMLACLVAGLWAVLGIGRHLHTPQDLAGHWQLTPLTATATPDSKPQMMIVEQSGVFFEVTFDQNPPLDLKLLDDSKQILLGKDCQLTFTGPTEDDKTVELTGPHAGHLAGQWTAHRVVRTFPADVESKGAK